MKRITLLIVAACIVFGACLTGCGGERDQEIYDKVKRDPKMYFVNYGPSGTWNVEVLMNGIPVVRATSNYSGACDVIYYMVDGSNTITVKAEQVDEMFAGPLTIQVVWVRRSHMLNGRPEDVKTLFEIVVEPKEIGYLAEESRTFEAEIPVRWTWLSAEAIEELTRKDREEILAIINSIYDAYKEKDVDKLASFSEIKFKDYVEFFSDSTIAENDACTFEKVFNDPLYSPKLRDENEIEMETFGKVVIVRGKPEDNEEVGSPEWIIHLLYEKTGNRTRAFNVNMLRFSKINGKWRLIGDR